MKHALTVYVIACGNRPWLETSLASLFHVLDTDDTISARVKLLGSALGDFPKDALRSFGSRLANTLLLEEKTKPGDILEMALTGFDEGFTAIVEDDVIFRMPFSRYIAALIDHPTVGAVSGQHSPEHVIESITTWRDKPALWKRIERGQCLTFRAETLEAVRPIVGSTDNCIIRYGENNLQKMGLKVLVLPGGVRHCGTRVSEWRTHWKKGKQIIPRIISEYTEEELNKWM